MRFVLSLAVACLAFGFAAAPQAEAQYPVYVPQSYVPQSYGPQSYVPQSYGQVVHEHHSHHCSPSTSQYYSGYGAPVYQYPSAPTYVSGYSAGAIYAQPVAPPTSTYYFNNTYYDGHSHHAWHPGHYLLGHH